MSAKLLVVYGGNPKLAKAVQERLRARGFTAHVGGEDRPRERSFFLGQVVLEQLDWAEQVVVLAQWPFEGTTKRPRTGPLYRPNLMFELGYVAGRLRRGRVHVFLIGLERKHLPSDLTGIWAHQIEGPHADIPALADEIADVVVSTQKLAPIPAIEPFLRWEEWKRRLERHVAGPSDLADLEACEMLLHSIQPALYFQDRKALGRIVDALAARLVETPAREELKYVIRVVRGVLDYYAVSVDEEPSPQYKEIADTLRDPLFDLPDDAPWAEWGEVVRRDFVGLCYRRRADKAMKDGDLTGAVPLRERACEEFTGAIAILGRIGSPSDPIRKLWSGYLYRNLSRTQYDLGREPEARANADIGYRQMCAATDDLRAFGIARNLERELALEEALRQIDPTVHTLTIPEFTEAVEAALTLLADTFPRRETSTQWEKLYTYTTAAAERLAHTSAIERLRALRSRTAG